MHYSCQELGRVYDSATLSEPRVPQEAAICNPAFMCIEMQGSDHHLDATDTNASCCLKLAHCIALLTGKCEHPDPSAILGGTSGKGVMVAHQHTQTCLQCLQVTVHDLP